MNAHLHDGSMQDVLVESTQSDGQLRDSSDENHSLLAEDPLTGLPWTETLLPLITSWAGSSAIHAICLHFVGLGILANIPELQSSHSLLKEATDEHHPPLHQARRVKFYYVTQAATRPPAFVFFTNQPEGIHFSYERYLLNKLRERFGFAGTPLRIIFRGREGERKK